MAREMWQRRAEFSRFRKSWESKVWSNWKTILVTIAEKSVASALLATNLLITPQWSLQKDINQLPEPVAIVQSACDSDQASKACVVELIKKYSKQYDVPVRLTMEIADCESDFIVDAVGDGGKAYGVYQFHKPTFREFSKKKGEKLDYFDTEDNIKLAIWALANNKGHHWSCYRKIAAR